MAKNVLLINGSPHVGGPTAHLIESCLQGMGEVALTRVDCFALTPLPCDDCRFCRKEDRCRHRDLDEVFAALEAADVLLFAAPVYNRGFPAPMKALLDRLQYYWSARFFRGRKPPIARPKKTVLLTAGGSGRGDGTALADQLAPVLTVLHSTPAACLHADGTDRAPVSDSLLAAARALGTAAIS